MLWHGFSGGSGQFSLAVPSHANIRFLGIAKKLIVKSSC